MEMGMIQIAVIGPGQSWRYTDATGTYKSNLEDQTKLDEIDGSVWPWYDSDQSWLPLLTGYTGLFKGGSAQAAQIGVADRPFMPVTAAPVANATNASIFDFDLYFAVRTTDNRHGATDADRVFTQYAKAEWRFNGSGAFDKAGVWSGTTGKEAKEENAGNWGDPAFTIAPGGLVPIPQGQTTNQAWRNNPGFSKI
jgi:hypothetical protein